MLEDPWAEFSKDRPESLSDSLRVQVGDSFINPAPFVPDTLESTGDVSQYSSFSSDKLEAVGEESTVADPNLSVTGSEKLSDSMVPMVGDSILERNNVDQ